MHRIGVVDTMFARYDMGAEVLDEFASMPGHGRRFEIVRRTVPGFKDLAVQAKRLIDEDACRIVVVLGMPGKEPIDKTCAHEASSGIMMAQLMTNTPILEVFVHEDESDDPEVLAGVCRDRSRKHAQNAYWMLYEPEELIRRAGQGVRQGFDDAGPLLPGAPPDSSAAPTSTASTRPRPIDDGNESDAARSKAPAPAGRDGAAVTEVAKADGETAGASDGDDADADADSPDLRRLPPPPVGRAFGAGKNSGSRPPGTAFHSSTSYDGMDGVDGAGSPEATSAAPPPPPPPPVNRPGPTTPGGTRHR